MDERVHILTCWEDMWNIFFDMKKEREGMWTIFYNSSSREGYGAYFIHTYNVSVSSRLTK